jgi:hypothetical protein
MARHVSSLFISRGSHPSEQVIPEALAECFGLLVAEPRVSISKWQNERFCPLGKGFEEA